MITYMIRTYSKASVNEALAFQKVQNHYYFICCISEYFCRESFGTDSEVK